MTAIEHITARHATCLSEYLKASTAKEPTSHWHGQLHGLEFAASCLDNDLGDALAKSRHLIDQMLLADLMPSMAERRTCAAEFNRDVMEGR